MFLNDFGDMLAPMRLALPEKMPSDRNDVETLRFAARVKNESGFLFINNYKAVGIFQASFDIIYKPFI